MLKVVAVVAVVAVVVVVVLLVAWVVRRRGTDEVHSVEGYRHTLDTLQSMRTPHPGASVRVLGDPATSGEREVPGPSGRIGPGLRAGDGSDVSEVDVPSLLSQSSRPSPLSPLSPLSQTSRPSSGLGQRPAMDRGETADESGRPLVFEDENLLAADAMVQTGALSTRRQARAMSAMNRRPRRIGSLVVVIVVVLAVIGLAVYGARSHRPAAKSASTSTHTVTHSKRETHAVTRSKSHSTAPSHSSGDQKKARTTTGKGRSGGKRHTLPTTTTTAVPAKFLPDPATATPTAATYTLPAGTYTLTLATTTGDCWVTVTTKGASVFSQTLPSGQRKSLTLSGATTILIGAPTYLAVILDHEPVVLPSGFQTPFTMTLQPAAT